MSSGPGDDVLRQLLCLGDLKGAQALERSGDLEGAWKACVQAVNERPFHPEAFVQMASIATAAGDVETARHALQRAISMAPAWKLPKELSSALGATVSSEPTSGSFILPAKQHGLSVCMIVKDEERFIGGALKSVQPIAQEIIVVDTGSKDKTVEIAEALGARVVHFKWCDDFSAARNQSLLFARAAWILVLDADEELMVDDLGVLESELKRDSNELLLRMRCVQMIGEKKYQGYIPRLFRNAPLMHFENRIHETVTSAAMSLCRSLDMELGLSRARLNHHGYSPEIVQDRNKVQRNLTLLMREAESNPKDAYMQMQLGNEYLRMGDTNKAFDHLEKAVHLCENKKGLLPDSLEVLLTIYGTNLLAQNRNEAVDVLLSGPLAKQYSLSAWHRYLRGRARMLLGRHAEALEDLLDAKARRHEETLAVVPADLDTPELDFMIGELQARLRHTDQAEASFRTAMAGDPSCVRYSYATAMLLNDRGAAPEALQLILESLTRVSETIELWRLGGQISLEARGLESFCVDWCRDGLQHHPGDERLMDLQAAALLQAGFTAEAHQWLRGLGDACRTKLLGARVFAAVCERDPEPPSLSLQQQRDAILTITSILQRLESREQLELIHRFRSNVVEYAKALPWVAEAFAESGIAP